MLWGELVHALPLAGEIGHDEQAQVALGREQDPVHLVVFDLDAVAAAEVREEFFSPRRPEVDEDDEDRQRAQSVGADAESVPDAAARSVRGDEVVRADRLGLARAEVANRRRDAVSSCSKDSNCVS